MTEEQIIQGNIIIGDFMMLNQIYNGNIVLNSYHKLNAGWIVTSPENLEFHSSWNWLMQVVEKIESMGYDTGICNVVINGERLSEILISPSDNEPKEGKIEIHERSAEGKIEATYHAVIQFIKWYNQLKQQ